jgi:hypothetical protein
LTFSIIILFLESFNFSLICSVSVIQVHEWHYYSCKQGCTNTRGLVAWATKFCIVVCTTFSIINYTFVIYKYILSVHKYQAESTTPELWFISVALALCHPYGVINLQLVPKFLENFWTKF